MQPQKKAQDFHQSKLSNTEQLQKYSRLIIIVIISGKTHMATYGSSLIGTEVICLNNTYDTGSNPKNKLCSVLYFPLINNYQPIK